MGMNNYRLTAKMADKIGRPDLRQKTVGISYMTADEKAAAGIASQVVIGDLYHEGECIWVNYVFGGAVKATRK